MGIVIRMHKPVIVQYISATFVFFSFTMIALPIIAAERLSQNDLIGTWTSNISVIKGEIQLLKINADHSVTFIRRFPNGVEQSLTTYQDAGGYQMVQDILILVFKKGTDKVVYKLVLSGWKTKNTKALYGTLFMYRDGIQFNGIPVSFRSSVSGSGNHE